MALCTRCEEQMVSDEANRCRDCIINENEDLVEDLRQTFQNRNLRQLMIIHSEARNRIIKERKDEEE